MYGNGTGAMVGAIGGYSMKESVKAQLGEPICQAREVPDQMERLEKALCYAQDSLQELIARLEPVTRPANPQTVGVCEEASGGPFTQHGGRLFGFALRAGSVGERIQDLLRRLEV